MTNQMCKSALLRGRLPLEEGYGMKMELVQAELHKHGEAIITTSGGQTFELHTGDVQFDLENRVIRFRSSGADFIIDGDSVEILQQHFSHLDND